MARVAFFMDQLLRKIGLSGKSIVPMLIGFGCSVPAIMATRTLTSDRDRKMTIMLVPFMSCSAKIPIYSVFVSAFFENYRASSKRETEITKAHLYADGFIGKEDSADKRKRLAKKLSLPENISTNALISALNIVLTLEDYKKACEEL